MREQVSVIEGLIETKSSVVLRTFKEDPAVHLDNNMVSRETTYKFKGVSCSDR